MTRRRILTVALMSVVALAAVALAYFSAQGSATASASVGTLPAPSITSATPGAGSVALAWSTVSPPVGSDPVKYYVSRDGNPAGRDCPTQPAPSTATTCTDSVGPGGPYSYTVTAVWHEFTATSTASQVTVTKQDQTITFTSNAPNPATVGGSSYTVSATASSGLTVAFTIDSSSTSVCSISGSSISFTAPGTCKIDADQASNASYNAAPQGQQSVTVVPTLTGVNPTHDPQGATSQTITLAGTGFESGANASFSGGGITVNSTTYVSSTKLTANITIGSAAASGARNVTVTNPDSTTATDSGAFTVDPGPTVTSATPASADQGASNLDVKIAGTGFESGGNATFSGTGITVNSTTYVSATQVTANVSIDPAATLGGRSVTVTNPDGSSATDANPSFTQAFGSGVQTGAPKPEACTTSCQSGIRGGGVGQLNQPGGVALDGSGNVYVGDQNNHRIDVFTSAGAFVRAFGSDVGGSGINTCTTSCQTGTSGGGAGQLNSPYGVALDGSGNVYVADQNNQRIDVFTSAGAFVRAFGGNVGGPGINTCTTTCVRPGAGGGAGQLFYPIGVALDGTGNVYVADENNQRIDVFTSAGAFLRAFGADVGGVGVNACTTSCQTGTSGGGAGHLNNPTGVALDAAGNVYVADQSNHRVDVFATAGGFVRAYGADVGGSGMNTCTTSCQTGTHGEGAGQLNYPTGVALDGAGNVYVPSNGRINVFSGAGAFVRAFGGDVGGIGINTCTTSCRFGTSGGGAGHLDGPSGVALDAAGNVYVADQNEQRIDVFSSAPFTVNPAPTVTSASPSSADQGAANFDMKITGTSFESGAKASFSGSGITVNSTTFVSATQLTSNISIDPAAATGARDATVTNLDHSSATGTGAFTVNAGPAITSVSPSSAARGAGNQDITINGTSFESGAKATFSGSGITVNSTTFVSATQLTANVSVDSGATLGGRSVTVTNPDGSSAIDANPSFTQAFGGDVGGPGINTCTSACRVGTGGGGAGQLYDPPGVAVDGAGNVYVADQSNQRIDVFTGGGSFTHAFGADVGGPGINTCTSTCRSGTAGGGAGQLNNPYGVAVDGTGNVYVADPSNQRIDVFTGGGSFTRAFGGNVGGAGINTCTSTCRAGTAGGGAGQLNNPYGVAVDGAGNVYVADQANQRIDVFTGAGSFTRAFGADVGGPGVNTCTSTCYAGTYGGGPGQLNNPPRVAVDGAGNVYVADYYNQRIDVFTGAGSFTRAFGADVGGPGINTCTSTCQTGTGGGRAGQLYFPYGVAVDGTGNVYVADPGNNRIDAFTGAGSFTRAFGRNVGGPGINTCTSTCRAGTGGGGAGQLNNPHGVAVDGAGNVYVADLGSQRIDQFTLAPFAVTP